MCMFPYMCTPLCQPSSTADPSAQLRCRFLLMISSPSLWRVTPVFPELDPLGLKRTYDDNKRGFMRGDTVELG